MKKQILLNLLKLIIASQAVVLLGSAIVGGIFVIGSPSYLAHWPGMTLAVATYSWAWATGSILLFGSPLLLIRPTRRVGFVPFSLICALSGTLVVFCIINTVNPNPNVYSLLIGTVAGCIYGFLFGAIYHCLLRCPCSCKKLPGAGPA